MLRSRKTALALVSVLCLVLMLLISCGTVAMSGALLQVMPVEVKKGGTVTLTGTAFQPDEKITISILIVKTALGTVTSDSKGSFVLKDVKIDEYPTTKPYTIVATGEKEPKPAQCFITVKK